MSWLRKDKLGADALEANAEDMPPPPPAPKMVWGKPTRCPECGGPGFLEHIDLRKGVMYQHGRECATEAGGVGDQRGRDPRLAGRLDPSDRRPPERVGAHLDISEPGRAQPRVERRRIDRVVGVVLVM